MIKNNTYNQEENYVIKQSSVIEKEFENLRTKMCILDDILTHLTYKLSIVLAPDQTENAKPQMLAGKPQMSALAEDIYSMALVVDNMISKVQGNINRLDIG